MAAVLQQWARGLVQQTIQALWKHLCVGYVFYEHTLVLHTPPVGYRITNKINIQETKCSTKFFRQSYVIDNIYYIYIIYGYVQWISDHLSVNTLVI